MNHESILSVFLSVMPLLVAGGCFVTGIMLLKHSLGNLPRLIMGISIRLLSF